MAQVLTEERTNTFHSFFESWLVEQDHYLEELVSASKRRRVHHHPSAADDDDTVLRQKIARVIDHYEQYYRAKSTCAKTDALPMFNPPWRSSLEDAFLWIGGWRPTMAFHLLYSKSGLQLQDKLADLLQGLAAGDLADLSPAQVNQINDLQRATVREEKEISEKLAKQQEKVADTSMVELSNAVTEAMRNPAAADDGGDGGRVAAALAPKEVGLAEVLQRADDLRLKTLKKVLGVLSPIQGVHFLIAAAELHLRLHEWGMKRDADTGHAA
ncbi:hypothetical protein ABFX02_12G039900 [Erythranthe guttata]